MQVYNLAKERKRQLDAIHEDGYHMPDSYDAPGKHISRYDVAKQRYQEEEDPEKTNPFAEQEKWEAEQMGRHMKVRGGKSSDTWWEGSHHLEYLLFFASLLSPWCWT